MRKLMPGQRPVDNVKLDPDFPQEEEFALNNEITFSYYNWWYFPRSSRSIAYEYLLDRATTEKDKANWLKNYKRFVKRCILNTKGQRFISKNPPNTARIPELLKLYPNAKFIFIHRNPYEVVRSTFAFYKSILPGVQLQDITEEELMADILKVYKLLIAKYEEDKQLIAQENLMEIRYANLVNDPYTSIKDIYDDLLKDDFSRIDPTLQDYLKQQSHALKTYQYQEDFIQKVNGSLEEIIRNQGYNLL
jgi:hypothetical protein